MKLVILLFITTIFFISCSHQKQDSPPLNGQIENAPNTKIYFEKITGDGDVPLDSTVTDENGKFTMTNRADGLDYYLLRTGNQSVVYMILKGGETITVTGDARDLEHTFDAVGSSDTRLLLQLKRYDTNLSDSMNKIYSAVRDENPMGKDSVGSILQQQYDSMMRAFSINFIQNNLTSLVSLSATQHLDKQKDFSLFEQLDQSLKKALDDNRYVEVFSKQVEDMKRLPVGSMAPEINLPDPNGKNISLSSLKGKVVVIDFWASWCGPCRREMPAMVELYKNFKENGLEIYGVSLDNNTDAWKNAITKDHISWIQVSDLKKWGSKPVLQYGIEEIPQTILLDRTGKIVAKGLGPDKLRIKVQEVIGNE